MHVQKRDAAIFDCDGTLVDVRGIRHLIKSPGGFDAFHYASASCPPNAWVVERAMEHHRNGDAVLIVTGRTEKFRRLTGWWLADHGVPSDALEMRPNGDYRKDFVIKEKILRGLRLQYNIIKAYDDNPAVIDLWKREGIPYTVVPGWET
jgi:phosphoglycolate phosphatase-like HAD superfamily hydrolase